VNSFWATEHISPFSLKRMHLLLVVPASRAMTYFAFIFVLLSDYAFIRGKKMIGRKKLNETTEVHSRQ
jgi:hypothetical protein